MKGFATRQPMGLSSTNGPGARIAQLVEQLTLIDSAASEIKSGPKRADVYLIFRHVRLTIRHPALAARHRGRLPRGYQ